MKTIERRIFNCSFPEYNGEICPVSMKFKENNKGDRPLPEAYLGNPQSKFMIIGINPGASENYIKCKNFEEYQNWIREHVPMFWQYHYVTEIFGKKYALKEGGAIVTNLIHCPTPSWTKQKEEKWRLNDEEKQKALELCSQFCFEIIEKVDPELLLLHGLDVAKFFSDRCKWGIGQSAANKDIHGLVKRCNKRTFVLSRHLRSICAKKGQGAWKVLEEIAGNFKKNRLLV